MKASGCPPNRVNPNRPLRAIPPETIAVHHITEADFTPDTPVCTPERLQQAIRGGERPDALVAHNCAFERLFLEAALPASLPWICTYKVALQVWPEALRHSNQVLRYWRDLRLDPALAMPPHPAGPDAYVTAHLLTELLGSASVEQMVQWTSQPKRLPWPEVPLDYLQWMARQTDMDGDAIWCAQQEMARRDTPLDRQPGNLEAGTG